MTEHSLRVALVLFGQPRFVENRAPGWSHRFALRRYRTEIFGHYWFDDSDHVLEAAPWSGLSKLKQNPNTMGILNKRYPGASLANDPPRFFETNQALRAKVLGLGNPSETLNIKLANFPNTASHIFSLSSALAKAREKHLAEPFDFVVVSRFDALILSLPNLAKLQSGSLYLSDEHDRFPDMIMFGSPENIFAIDAWSLIEQNEVGPDELVAEDLKRKAYLSVFGQKTVIQIRALSKPLRRDTYSYAASLALRTYIADFRWRFSKRVYDWIWKL